MVGRLLAVLSAAALLCLDGCGGRTSEDPDGGAGSVAIDDEDIPDLGIGDAITYSYSGWNWNETTFDGPEGGTARVERTQCTEGPDYLTASVHNGDGDIVAFYSTGSLYWGRECNVSASSACEVRVLSLMDEDDGRRAAKVRIECPESIAMEDCKHEFAPAGPFILHLEPRVFTMTFDDCL